MKRSIIILSILLFSLYANAGLMKPHKKAFDGDKYVQQSPTPPTNNKTSVHNCIHYNVYGIEELNIRDKPENQSNIVGKVANNESLCIYEFSGKWGRSDRGWISGKYLELNYDEPYYLLADVDGDGKQERLEWKYIGEDNLFYYQLTLYNDDGSIMWSGPKKSNTYNPLVAYTGDCDGNMPVILNDIDGDGNIELLLGGLPHEPVSPGYNIFRWDGNGFTMIKNTIHLIWVDPPNGKTLKWKKIDFNSIYAGQKKIQIWWAHSFEQTGDDILPIVTIQMNTYPDVEGDFNQKAKVRFTPTGAIIEEWLK